MYVCLQVGNAVRVARYYEGYGLHPTGKTPAPQTDQWEARTRIYTHPPANTAAATASASTDTRAVSRNGSRPSARGGASNSASMAVPKTLGVAQCGGCAKRAFSSGSSGGGGLRRCQRVELPELLAWTEVCAVISVTKSSRALHCLFLFDKLTDLCLLFISFLTSPELFFSSLV